MPVAVQEIYDTLQKIAPPELACSWDNVGLLTGRYEKFDTIRTPGGISGFTNRSESEYDVLTAGH